MPLHSPPSGHCRLPYTCVHPESTCAYTSPSPTLIGTDTWLAFSLMRLTSGNQVQARSFVSFSPVSPFCSSYTARRLRRGRRVLQPLYDATREFCVERIR
jgi:hypothetical protein